MLLSRMAVWSPAMEASVLSSWFQTPSIKSALVLVPGPKGTGEPGTGPGTIGTGSGTRGEEGRNSTSLGCHGGRYHLGSETGVRLARSPHIEEPGNSGAPKASTAANWHTHCAPTGQWLVALALRVATAAMAGEGSPCLRGVFARTATSRSATSHKPRVFRSASTPPPKPHDSLAAMLSESRGQLASAFRRCCRCGEGATPPPVSFPGASQRPSWGLRVRLIHTSSPRRGNSPNDHR